MKNFSAFVSLNNYTKTRKSKLPRFWDSADEYLGLISEKFADAGKRVVIVNDDSGIIAEFLADSAPVSVTDFFDTYQYLSAIKVDVITLPNFYNETEERYDCALVHIPKSMELFRAQLQALSRVLKDGAVIFCAGMVKHLSPHVKQVLSDLVGETKVHKTYKKAVLFESKVQKSKVTDTPLNNSVMRSFAVEKLGVFNSYPGVFSQGKLDGGTRLLIESLPTISGKVLDLGCGYGVISKVISQQGEKVDIDALDISFSAVASSITSVKEISGIPSNGLSEVMSNTYDWVVSNPPFHTGNKLDVPMTVKLLKDVQKIIHDNSSVILVGNKGLRYDLLLEKIFKRVTVFAENKKYAVYLCKGVN